VTPSSKRENQMEPHTPRLDASPSHVIVHVSNTDDTIAFYQSIFDGAVTDDHTFSAPSLDQIFGREGVVIRSTFIEAGGYRLHTIETIDVPRERPPVESSPPKLGLGGISFLVAGLDALHARATSAGLAPTSIYEFNTELMDHTARMFFLRDPEGVRLELIENT
jgi:catechol 2,3-dioxygenase-like lactoylglutathione lyase family enzyme